VIELEFDDGRPVFPEIELSAEDRFLKQFQSSQKKWVVLTDNNEESKVIVNSDEFLRAAIIGG